MDKEYNSKFKNNIDELLPVLKEGFISFYGEEYQDRISNTIDSTRFVFIDDDNKLCPDINTDELTTDDQKIVDEILKNNAEALGGIIPNMLPPTIIYKVGDPLSLHALTHELNHALHIGKATNITNPLFLTRQFTPSIGFTGRSNDYVYELVNEYMTSEVLKKVKDKVLINESIDTSFDEKRYVYLDEIADGETLDIYKTDREKIKDKLINLRGYEYPYEFGYDKYEELLTKYNTIQKEYEKEYIPLIAKGLPSDVCHELVVEDLIDKFSNDNLDLKKGR